MSALTLAYDTLVLFDTRSRISIRYDWTKHKCNMLQDIINKARKKRWCKTCIFIWRNRSFFKLISGIFPYEILDQTDFFPVHKVHIRPLNEKQVRNSRPKFILCHVHNYFLFPFFMQHSICALFSIAFFSQACVCVLKNAPD